MKGLWKLKISGYSPKGDKRKKMKFKNILKDNLKYSKKIVNDFYIENRKEYNKTEKKYKITTSKYTNKLVKGYYINKNEEKLSKFDNIGNKNIYLYKKPINKMLKKIYFNEYIHYKKEKKILYKKSNFDPELYYKSNYRTEKKILCKKLRVDPELYYKIAFEKLKIFKS